MAIRNETCAPGSDLFFMEAALRMARIAASKGEIPIGAVIVKNGRFLSAAHNEKSDDPTAHAEITAVRRACRVLGTWNLSDCTLYVTLEPCPMCAGALVLSRVRRIVYGCGDPRAGACGTLYSIPEDSRLNHRCAIAKGVLAKECSEVLVTYFEARRKRS
jgi:tRNA(adenine34) deaminase